jgi:hypothetical protein
VCVYLTVQSLTTSYVTHVNFATSFGAENSHQDNLCIVACCVIEALNKHTLVINTPTGIFCIKIIDANQAHIHRYKNWKRKPDDGSFSGPKQFAKITYYSLLCVIETLNKHKHVINIVFDEWVLAFI